MSNVKRCPACGMDNIHTMYCGHINMESLVVEINKLKKINLELRENLEILGNGLSNAMSRNAALNIINDLIIKLEDISK